MSGKKGLERFADHVKAYPSALFPTLNINLRLAGLIILYVGRTFEQCVCILLGLILYITLSS